MNTPEDQTPTEIVVAKPFFKRKLFIVAASLVSLIVIANVVSGCSKNSTSSNTSNSDSSTSNVQNSGPVETLSETNARGSAAAYLDSGAFSRSGLIDQLKYEGYSTADATYGVDAQGADWNEEAALSAKEYLNSGSFSASELYDQLVYEGFTSSQASYGVHAVGD